MSDPAINIDNIETPQEPVFPVGNQAILVVVLSIAALLGITAIRTLALRVTQYQVDVYENYVNDAMLRQDYDRAVEICTGAIRASVNTSAHWGRAWALRAQAHHQAKHPAEALADLRRSHVFFQQRYYYAESADRARLAEVATDVAKDLLTKQDAPSALAAFSIAAAESGQPLDYLTRLHDSLAEPAREMLWGDGKPHVVLREFPEAEGETGLTVVAEQQGRQVQAAGVDTSTQPGSVYIELGPASAEGRSTYAANLWMPIAEKPHAIRLIARADGGPMPAGYVNFWFDSARESVSVTSSEWAELADGWQACTIPSTFKEQITAQAQARGFTPHEGILNRAGFEFSSDSAPKARLARVELVLE